jgi:hypothetical protein
MAQDIVLPSGFCFACFGERTAKYGYGRCDSCNGASSLDYLEDELEALEEEFKALQLAFAGQP